ncbi:MAG: hypothetical protein CMLOHMNK_01203 [Steroidobacteraceae bacterium]|nr:hypothetical protein [Steroidobacteraceae bacterium]
MTRKVEPGLLEGLFELLSRLPWWLGMAAAVVSFVLLHEIATQPHGAEAHMGDIGSTVASEVWRTAAAFGQVILPLLFGAAATISAIRARQRKRNPDQRHEK